MNCCNDYGQCTQGQNCPARGRSEYDANRLMTNITPPNYMPKITFVQQSIFHDVCEYFADAWRHVLLGFLLGALMAVALVIKLNLLG